MQFNSTADSQGILQDVDYMCGTNSATYSIADKTRNVNRWYHAAVVDVLDNMDEWDLRGSISYQNLVANQQAYAFPTDILTIKRLEVDYDGDGDYILSDHVDMGTIDSTIATSAEINDNFNTGNPKYDAWNNSAYLFPVPDAAVNSGLIIWYNAEVTELTATTGGNTAEPALAEPFHIVLSLGASLDYARRNKLSELIAFCERELFGTDKEDGLITKMKKYYGTRSSDKILSMKSHYYEENYK
jgi:hypothetical protein